MPSGPGGGASTSCMTGVPSSSAVQPGRSFTPKSAGEDELVGGDDACRGVEYERRFPIGRRGQCQWVGAEPGLSAECGIDVGRTRRHGHTDHVVFQGHHRMIGDHAEMPAVADGYDPNADVPRLLDGDLHCFRADDDAESPVGVDVGRGRRLSQRPSIAAMGLSSFFLESLHVAPERVGYAVAFYSSQVGDHQDVGRLLSVLVRHAAFEKHSPHDFAQVALVDSHGVLFGHPQSLYHLAPPALVRLHKEQF